MPDDPCPLCSAGASTRRVLLAIPGEALDWSTCLFSIECSERWARGASERADDEGRDDLAAKLRGCESGLAHGGGAIRALIQTRARVAEVEAERDAARVDLVWHEQMNGTRAEQEAHDAEADAVDAAAEALTPEQLRAEMIEIGLDPDRVEREAEVSARLIVRCMQARDERDAARAEIERMHADLGRAVLELRGVAALHCPPGPPSVIQSVELADAVQAVGRELEALSEERDAAHAALEELRLALAAEQGKFEGLPFSSPPHLKAAVNAERIRQGLSWRELAAQIDVSSSGFTRWNAGRDLSVPAYLKVCDWLRAAMIAADKATT